MKKNESSITSLISAFSRSYHSAYDTPVIFNDFIAKDLITETEFAEISANLENGAGFFRQGEADTSGEDMLKWITQVQLSPTPLSRAAFCEHILMNELRLGAGQYVILGAGMDTFALRHLDLIDRLEIFEVDHPATQEFKKQRLEGAGYQLPGNLHFVPADFTKDSIAAQLAEAGFSTGKKTFISLLGVSYYLTKDELSSMLKQLFAGLPEGSSIVFDYPDENLFEESGLSNRVKNMVQMAASAGEPMKSCFTYEEIEGMLQDAGMLIYEHLDPAAINGRFFSSRADYLSAFETVHFIHAVKK